MTIDWPYTGEPDPEPETTAREVQRATKEESQRAWHAQLLRDPYVLKPHEFVTVLDFLCLGLWDPDWSTRMNLLARTYTRGRFGYGRSHTSSRCELRPAVDVRPIRADEYPPVPRPDFPRLRLHWTDPENQRLLAIFAADIERSIDEAKAEDKILVVNGMTHKRTFINVPAEEVTLAEHIDLYNRPWHQYDAAVKRWNYENEKRRFAEHGIAYV